MFTRFMTQSPILSIQSNSKKDNGHLTVLDVLCDDDDAKQIGHVTNVNVEGKVLTIIQHQNGLNGVDNTEVFFSIITIDDDATRRQAISNELEKARANMDMEEEKSTAGTSDSDMRVDNGSDMSRTATPDPPKPKSAQAKATARASAHLAKVRKAAGSSRRQNKKKPLVKDIKIDGYGETFTIEKRMTTDGNRAFLITPDKKNAHQIIKFYKGSTNHKDTLKTVDETKFVLDESGGPKSTEIKEKLYGLHVKGVDY